VEVALAGHRGDATTARRGLASPDARVREVAVGALARAGALDAQELAAAIGSDPGPGVRRRACDVAATFVHDGGVAAALRRALCDTDPLVVEAACWALGELYTAPAPDGVPGEPAGGGERTGADDEREARDAPDLGAVVESLAVTARTHDDARAREAAVAALGSIGDARGLGAVLDALGDRPAVRRRAVVALAAFEGEAVGAALRRSAEDRDWQVREVAEILLEE
jgi:HEAT repeat protein